MKQPLSTIFFAILLLRMNVSAMGTADLVRTFVYDDYLYTYIDTESLEHPLTKLEAKVGIQTFPVSGTLETVEQAQSPITYLLLVDNSTSMPSFKNEIISFTKTLTQFGGKNTRFHLATFGDSFSLCSEDMSRELADQVAEIPFDERVTRLHAGIGHAVDHLESIPRQGNELRVLVVLSDGVQYDPQNSITYEALLDQVSASDVMLHSVGFGKDNSALAKLRQLSEASGGSHQVVNKEVTPENAAVQLKELNGKLRITKFDLSGCETFGEDIPVSVTFFSGAELLCQVETILSIPEIDVPQLPVSPTESRNSLQPDVLMDKAGEDGQSATRVVFITGGAVTIFLIAITANYKRKH